VCPEVAVSGRVSETEDVETTIPARREMTSTRALLVCQAFGAIGAVLLLIVAPFTSLVAAVFPPLYALLAGLHSILPFFARRALGFTWAATAVGATAGLLGGAFTPIGLLIMVPLVLSGFCYDLTLLVARRIAPRSERSPWSHLSAAVASAVALFLVSLPIMSPERLGFWIMAATFAGRVIGQVAASLLAGALAHRVERVGGLRLLHGRRP
jgi:hypothetical protein